MTTIVTRSGKGSALSFAEVDGNFTNLNTDKVEKSGTDPIVIAVSSASDALRVTQTGAGNALVVEDATNPDSSPFVVDASGNTIVGYTSTAAISGLTAPQFQVQGATTGSAGLSVHATDTTNAGGWQSAKSRGTLASPTVVNSGDSLGILRFAGHDGTAYIRSAEIFAQVDGTPGTNDMPGRLVFSTTADGASTPTERMRIDSSGRVGIGITPTVALDVLGVLEVQAAATQDAIKLQGRAGGTSSYAVTLTPATLSANRTVTIPDESFTVGYRNVPAVGTKTGSYTLAVADVGKYVQVGTGGSITIPDATFSEGDVISLFNNTTGNITITCSITTAYIAGTDADKATITLATRGVATILFISGTICVVSGNVS